MCTGLHELGPKTENATLSKQDPQKQRDVRCKDSDMMLLIEYDYRAYLCRK